MLEGLKVKGDDKSIVITIKNGEEYLQFLSQWVGDSIFELQTSATIHMVSSIPFSIVHHRFAHPSSEVLRQIPKNMLLSPVFDIPREIPICPGCAKGKMTQ